MDDSCAPYAVSGFEEMFKPFDRDILQEPFSFLSNVRISYAVSGFNALSCKSKVSSFALSCLNISTIPELSDCRCSW